jgi:hypothetical protein
VPLGLKVLGARDVNDRAGDRLFHLRGEGEVNDFAAADAEKMVVVLGEVFCELKASELVVGGDAAHQSGGLEVHETAVCGASRQLRKACCNVLDADRMAHSDEEFDDRSTTCRVALVTLAKAGLDEAVEVFARSTGGYGAHAGFGTLVPVGNREGFIVAMLARPLASSRLVPRPML